MRMKVNAMSIGILVLLAASPAPVRAGSDDGMEEPVFEIQGAAMTYSQREAGVLTETGSGAKAALTVTLLEEQSTDVPKTNLGKISAHLGAGAVFTSNPDHPVRPIGEFGVDIESYFSPKSAVYLALGSDVIDLDPTRDRLSGFLEGLSPIGGVGVGARSKTLQGEILWTPYQIIHERNTDVGLQSSVLGTELNATADLGTLGELAVVSQLLLIDHQFLPDTDTDKFSVLGVLANVEVEQRIPFRYSRQVRGALEIGASVEHVGTDHGVDRTTMTGDLEVTAAF